MFVSFINKHAFVTSSAAKFGLKEQESLEIMLKSDRNSGSGSWMDAGKLWSWNETIREEELKQLDLQTWKTPNVVKFLLSEDFLFSLSHETIHFFK